MKKEFKIVICGGGSTYTAGIVKNLLEEEELKIKELWLYDIDQERQEKVSLIVKEVVKDLRPSLELKISTDEEEAFTDADFIMAQMRVGGLKMRVKDEQISLKHGCIGQETCGAGGMAYGMRTIGPMVHLIDVCEKYASKTYWIVNYSNPAAIVAKATQTLRPNARILNICDMPVEVEARMAEILDTDLSNLEVDYFGLNHYGWFTHVYDKHTGEDLLPKIRQIVAEKGFLPQDAEQRDPSWLETYGFVQDIMNDFPDYLPNTYDGYYLYPEYKYNHLDHEYTRADEVIAGRETRVFKECREVIANGKLGEGFHSISDAHAEMMIKVAEAIAFNKNTRFIVIVENNGAINNLQDDAMVEVVCELGINGPRPMAVGNIPQFYYGLLAQQVSSEKLLIDAYYEKSYQKALQALTLNRLINDAKKAREILDALIIANKDMWPDLH